MQEDLIKQRIVQQSLQMFLRQGLKTVTMDMIATELGISKRTLYEKFRDKDELVLASMELHEQNRSERDRLLSLKANNTIELLLMFYKEALEEIALVNPNFHSDLRRYHPKVSKALDDFHSNKKDMTTELLEQGIKEGYIRPELNLESVSFLLKAQFNAMNTLFEDLEYRLSFSSVFETSVMIFIRGVVSQKGLKIIQEFFNESTIE